MMIVLLLPGHTKERGRAGADGVTLTVNEIKKKISRNMSTGRVICYCPKPELQLGNVWNAKFSILFSCLFRLHVCCVL